MADPRDHQYHHHQQQQQQKYHRTTYSPSHSPPNSSMSIPIPSHYPPPGGSAERSPRPLPSPSSSRSPSQSSLSSYRAHPYPRRSSVTQIPQSADDRFLPPPNSNAPLHVLHEGRRHRSGSDEDRHHERTHSSERDREWRDHRPPLARAQSDRASYQLPPFSSLTGSQSSSSSPSTYPLTPTSNGVPPAAGAPMGPPPQPTSPNGSRAASPKLFSLGAGLRSSYNYDAPAPRQSLGLSSCYRGEHSPPRYDRDLHRERERGPGPDRSPPLRSIHSTAVYHDQYHQGRARSHSAASALSRYPSQGGPGPLSTASDSEWASPSTPSSQPTPAGGQSRRLAHLMSEQKRRESINTGFQALRGALPSAIPTDSKAIILRKAVSHISRLESLMRKHGIDLDATDLPEDDEVTMRETTGGVRDLSVQPDRKWEDVQIEDVSIRKPTIA